MEALKRHWKDQAERRLLVGAAWKPEDLVFDGGDGGPVHPDELSQAFRRFTVRAGLPAVRFHDLRHGHATLMLSAGVHAKVVSERLGHAGIAITIDMYSHVLPALEANAARVLK